MNKQFLIFMLLLVTYTTAYAEFVEQFRSEPKRRFAKALKNVLSSDEYSTRDLNGNSINDHFHIEVDGASGGYLCSVYDGLSKSQYLQFPLPYTVNNLPLESLSLNFFYLKGDNPPTLVLQAKGGNEVAMEELYLINIGTGQVEYSVANVKFIGVANVDNDLVPEIFYFDLNTREIVIIEWKEGGNINNSIVSLDINEKQLPTQLNKSNLDYTLTLKYESAPKTQLIYDDSIFESVNDLDADGDGIMDLAIAVENQAQQPVALAVIDGPTKSLKWAFQYPAGQLDEFSNFRGFYDVDGSGVKEAVFGNRTVVTVDKNVYSLNENFKLQAVYDVDNDGYPDFLGIGLQDSTVQVWGIESPSGVSDKDLIAAGFQLQQNYPNPFNPSTRIQYQVSSNSMVSLKVYDVLGNEVATLVNEYKPAGSYEVNFDATNLASGMYLYKIQAGSFVETKKMILLR